MNRKSFVTLPLTCVSLVTDTNLRTKSGESRFEAIVVPKKTKGKKKKPARK